ncbi:hypothetical protein ES702_06252 [subsurface metagenome]
MPGDGGACGKPQINDNRALSLHFRAFLHSQEKALRGPLICYSAEQLD